MKKVVVAVLAVAVILGAGLAIKKTYDRAGEPPIGGVPVVASISPNGEPPIGG